MTRSSKKEREKFYAAQWLLRRRIKARLEDSEHPDFVVRLSGETLGIEIIEYHSGVMRRGGSRGRQVEAAWEALQDYSDMFRERNLDIDHVDVRLHFKAYRMPPRRLFESFCSGVADLIREATGLIEGVRHTIKMKPELHPLLADYLDGIEFFGGRYWSHWEWPAYMNGAIGTSEEELHAVVASKLATYRAPSEIDSSHLVIVGGGPARTRIAAPISAQHLSTYSMLNEQLNDGPFASVAILCLRDFIWTRADGWKSFPAYD